MKKSSVALSLMVPAMMLAGCGTTPAGTKTTNNNHSKINIVAAEDFYGEVASAGGGNHVNVTSILNDPNVDPHQYEATPNASMAVQKAQLVIYTGIGYDDWMKNIVQASSGNRDVIDVGADLLGKQDGDNPHVWYLPSTMPILANKIADDLATLDPSHAGYYRQCAKAYSSTLQPIDTLIQQLKQPRQTEVDVSEPVFDYMLNAMNMVPNDPKFAKSIEDGNEPTPTDVAGLQHDIAGHKIKLFVENIQTDDPTVKSMAQLAKQNHIPAIAVTETEPKGKDYVQWMMNQLREVETAIQQK